MKKEISLKDKKKCVTCMKRKQICQRKKRVE